jgi:hypothetical protein
LTLNFELLFAAVNGQWRLFGISINLGQAAPVPPSPQASSTPQPQASQKPPVAAVRKVTPMQKPAPEASKQ